MPVSQRNRLVNALVRLSASASGRGILRDLGADGFVTARNSDYLTLVPPEAGP